MQSSLSSAVAQLVLVRRSHVARSKRPTTQDKSVLVLHCSRCGHHDCVSPRCPLAHVFLASGRFGRAVVSRDGQHRLVCNAACAARTNQSQHVEGRSPHYSRDHRVDFGPNLQKISVVKSDETSNQALERTADRRVNLLLITSTLNSEAQLAIVSGRSACSR